MKRKDIRKMMDMHRPWYKTAVIVMFWMLKAAGIMTMFFIAGFGMYVIKERFPAAIDFYDFTVFLGKMAFGLAGVFGIVYWTERLYKWAHS